MKKIVLVAVLVALAPLGSARAATPASASSSLLKTSKDIEGGNGIRPFLGASSHLDIGNVTPAGGNKLVFGLDYLLGNPTGLNFVLGLHMGAGGRAFLLYPLLEVHYRFALPIPLVPWIGAGVGTRVAFARDQSVHFGLGFRFVAGADYFFTPSVGLGMQLAVPDIGPLFTPTNVASVVGTIEWTLGPHFRF